MHGLLLRHEVLDAQLLDRNGAKIGRADSVVLELRPGEPPRVAAILTGGHVRERRVGRWAVALARVLRAIGRARQSGVSRIDFARVRRIANGVTLDVDGRTLDAMHLERWLAEHIVRHIPGASGARK